MRSTRRGFQSTPPLATAAMKRATCSGVTRTWPWPIDMLTMSPPCQDLRRPLGCGIKPSFSPPSSTPVAVLDHAEPRRPIDRRREAIDLERRRRHERTDVPAAGIHDYDGAGLALHRLFGGFLDAPVDGGDDLRAGMRIGVLHHAHGPAE